MREINLDKEFIEFTGEVVQGANMAKALASKLFQSTTGDPLKLFMWSQELYKTGKIVVDDSDYKTILEFIKNLNQLPAGFKAQLLKEIE